MTFTVPPGVVKLSLHSQRKDSFESRQFCSRSNFSSWGSTSASTKLYIKKLRCQLKWLVWPGPQASQGEGNTTGIVMKWFPQISPWVQWGKHWRCFLPPLSALAQVSGKWGRGQWEIRKFHEEGGCPALGYSHKSGLHSVVCRVKQTPELKQLQNCNWESCAFCS